MTVEALPVSYLRLPAESAKAYAAFRLFRDLPARQRSYPIVAQGLSVSRTLIKRWGSKWAWQRRAAAWDDEVDRQTRERLTDDTAGFARRQAAAARQVQEAVLHRLQLLTDAELRRMSVNQLIRWAYTAVQMERQALGGGDLPQQR